MTCWLRKVGGLSDQSLKSLRGKVFASLPLPFSRQPILLVNSERLPGLVSV